jgi:hypothetical protein
LIPDLAADNSLLRADNEQRRPVARNVGEIVEFNGATMWAETRTG